MPNAEIPPTVALDLPATTIFSKKNEKKNPKTRPNHKRKTLYFFRNKKKRRENEIFLRNSPPRESSGEIRLSLTHTLKVNLL